MTSISIEDALNIPFTYTERPVPLPCHMRPVWRMHILLLLLNKCYGAKAGFEQIHVLNWAIRTHETRASFLQYLEGKRGPNQIIVRYDPSLNRAVQFAFAEGLVIHHESEQDLLKMEREASNNYRVILTEKGFDFVKRIYEMEDCFVAEKRFLASIKSKVSQKQVKSLFTWS